MVLEVLNLNGLYAILVHALLIGEVKTSFLHFNCFCCFFLHSFEYVELCLSPIPHVNFSAHFAYSTEFWL